MAERKNLRKVRVGTVKSAKMDKTVVVQVDRLVRHPTYKKVIKVKKSFHAHDENNSCKEGDRVRIMECRPLSKTKRWRVVETIREAVTL